MSLDISNYMTTDGLVGLLQYIQHYHSFRYGGKRIKYVVPHYDTRTGRIFCIELDDKAFSITNDNRHRKLIEWVMEYLKEDN